MNPFTPNHSTPFLDVSTTDAMKNSWAKLAKKEAEALTRLEQELECAKSGTLKEKMYQLTHSVHSQKLGASWVSIENQVCVAFFKFLDAQPDSASRAAAIEAMPVLPRHSYMYTPNVQMERVTYWLSLIP